MRDGYLVLKAYGWPDEDVVDDVKAYVLQGNQLGVIAHFYHALPQQGK
jgi:hypothetical protein